MKICKFDLSRFELFTPSMYHRMTINISVKLLTIFLLGGAVKVTNIVDLVIDNRLKLKSFRILIDMIVSTCFPLTIYTFN